jgi:formylmethanofuran dehydrogenase subunit E
MNSKIYAKSTQKKQLIPNDFGKIAIELPEKYRKEMNESAFLEPEEENALFSYLVNEFFRQIEKKKILAKEYIAELSFLCESYFDYRELEVQEIFENEMNYSEM